MRWALAAVLALAIVVFAAVRPLADEPPRASPASPALPAAPASSASPAAPASSAAPAASAFARAVTAGGRDVSDVAPLIRRLDSPRPRVREALGGRRAELSAALGRAVAVGYVTPRGRALALACFDTPADCPLRALRWELGFGAIRHTRP